MIGVIEPGAAAAVAACVSRHIAVIGTEGTIEGGAYQAAIERLMPDGPGQRARLPAVRGAGRGGMDPAARSPRRWRAAISTRFSGAGGAPDTLVLGCTHFPVLRESIRAILPASVRIVDSAETTAQAVRRALPSAAASASGGRITWLATDMPSRFARVGGTFLGEPLRAADVELVDL